MFKLIDRYVLKEIAAPSLLGLLVYTAIFIVSHFFRLADQWVKGTLTMVDVGWTLVYYMPSVIVLTIPMSVLLGVLIGFSRLSADSEITALRTTGVSYFRLLVPTLLLAVPAWALATVTYLRAVPWANTRAIEVMTSAARRTDLNREIRPGTWMPLSDGVPGQDAAIFARGIDKSDPDEPWLTSVDIVSIDRANGDAWHYQASRARIERVLTGDETGRLKFYFEDLRSIGWKPDATAEKPTILEAPRGDRLGPERRMQGSRSLASERRIDKGVRMQTLSELRRTLADLREMDAIDELKKTNPKEAAVRQAGSRVPLVPQVRERQRRLATMEIHKKFALPVACLVFALIGMPLGISTRRGGRPASFAISIAVVLLWWVVFNACETWCLAGRLSPATAAWLANVLVGLVAVHALVSQRRHQAVGLYRALRDGLLLSGAILLLLAGVLAFERHESLAAGRLAPGVPAWLPVAGVLMLVAHAVFLWFRDPIARRLADFSEAFRRPRATGALEEAMQDALPSDVHATASEPEPPPPALASVSAPAPLQPHEERRWLRRARLERLRGSLLFGLLAMLVFSVVEIFQHDQGPGPGLRDWVASWEPMALGILAIGCLALQGAGVRIVSTLDWWVLTSLSRAFALVMTSMAVLYVVVHYVELAEVILKHDVRVATVAEYFWHLAPRIVTETLPYGGMLAALITFGMMSKFNESTAVRCGGVSVWRTVLPAVVSALLLSSVAFVLHDYVLPRSNQKADDIKRQMQGAPPQRRATMHGFLMGADGKSLYQFRSVVTHQSEKEGLQAQLTGLTLLRQGPSGHVEELWNATDAVWERDRWVLRNGWRAVIDASNQVRVEPFATRPLSEMERPDYFAALRRNPDQMAFSEFSRYVAEQAAAGFPTAPLRVELQEKLAFPAATLILVLIGLPFAFTTGRRGALYGIGIALILGVLYKAAVAFFTAMGSAEYLPPLAAAWAPNAIFGMAGIYLLLHVRT